MCKKPSHFAQVYLSEHVTRFFQEVSFEKETSCRTKEIKIQVEKMEVSYRRKQFKGKTSKVCFVCKKPGHFAKVCLGEHVTSFYQGSQYRTGGCTGLASGTIYFEYRSIPVYRFGFTAIFYIYK